VRALAYNDHLTAYAIAENQMEKLVHRSWRSCLRRKL